MRRLFLLELFVLLCAIPAHGQSTTVSGTVTDAGSQAWANGTYKFLFQPNPQYPTGPYTWTGGTLNQVISGTLDGSGHYSVSVPSNSAITPVGSAWVLQVTPNATSPSFTTAPTNIVGGTSTLNATPPAILIPWSIPLGPAISAYSDSEIGGTLPKGAEYFNVTTGFTRVWNGTTWANQGGGGLTSITSSIQFVIDGGGATPSPGIYGQLSIPAGATIHGWVITSDQPGSAVVDVLKSTYAAFPTTASIAGTDKPTLSSVQKNEDLTLTGWGNTAINAGDIVQINLNSVSTVTRINLTINITEP